MRALVAARKARTARTPETRRTWELIATTWDDLDELESRLSRCRERLLGMGVDPASNAEWRAGQFRLRVLTSRLHASLRRRRDRT